ncbi:MAG: HAMP domain-containing histidine kinase, partial [Methylococcales bacterium]|nr:HAMP domain-containing histidine kinase [Methylococcales bacterium]
MNASTAQKILAEQINLLIRQTPLIVGGGLLTAGVMVYVLSDWVPERDLRIWFGAIFLLSVVRFYSLWQHRQIPTTPELAKSRARLLTLYSGLSGCLWGQLGFFAVVPEQPVGSVRIVMVLTGMVASGIASLSHRLSAFYAFTIPALLPAAYRFTTLTGDIFTVVAVLIALFLFASLFFAHGIHKTLLESVRLRFENVDLIANLSLEKQRAEAAQRQAELASIAKSKFLAAASHDLRQPMHALNLFATTLDERIQDPENKALVENIILSVKALVELFIALLDISKLDAGTLSVEKQHFKLQDLFDHLHNDFTAEAGEKGLRMDINGSAAVVYSDPLLLQRILRNLLSNAVRFTKAGTVTINTVALDGAVCIEVSDTGSGIADEDLDKIYEEFVQLHNPERDRSKGLGLGLSIVKRIALLLDHQVTVDSTVGKGSGFSLFVPL